MIDSKRHRDWLDKAAKDINSAKVLKEHDCGNDVVAFHCQQAIEKILKAYIIFNTGFIISSHSLIFLCKEASKFNVSLRTYIKDCAFVNQFYIETRYPADDPLIVTDEEAGECISIASTIYEHIHKLID